MKKYFIGFLFTLFSLSAFAQGDNGSTILSYDQVEEPPLHKDCEALNGYGCSLNKISGYLTGKFNNELFLDDQAIINFKMKFIIDKTGKVAWIKALSKSDAINDEAEKLMKEMPALIPGRENGKEVSVMYLMPVTIKYLYQFPNSYSLSEVDVPPLLKKCGGANEMKTCFNREVSILINRKYGFKSVPDGINSAAITMLIDENGEITEYLVKSDSEDLKKGLEKIRKRLPDFESGAVLEGEKVRMTINIPVIVNSTNYK